MSTEEWGIDIGDCDGVAIGVLELRVTASGQYKTKAFVSGTEGFRHWRRRRNREQLARKRKRSGHRARRRGPWTGRLDAQ